MVFAIRPIILSLFSCISLALIASSKATDPIPTIWPEQFHSILFMNTTGTLRQIDLWYDWPNGRNFNIIQKQLDELLYDLEWNNGTSFHYTLDSNKKCKVLHFSVGIITPNWLHGATYIGQRYSDNFLCNVWEKVDFITYFEDVVSKRPVSWTFYTGMTAHVMTFEVGKVLEDPKWQAPVYCFNKIEEEEDKKTLLLVESVASPHHGNLMRPLSVAMNISMLL